MALVHSWLNPKCEVRNAEGAFRGVFAVEAVSAGELLCITGGHVMRVTEDPVLNGETKDLAIMINEEFCIGPKYELEIEDSDFFNHSCNPNAGLRGQIFLVAMRDIQRDEEVAFDYAMVLYESPGNLENYEFYCHCGSGNCRGKVTGNDWKLPNLQKRYDGYFSWYLQERIDKMRADEKEE